MLPAVHINCQPIKIKQELMCDQSEIEVKTASNPIKLKMSLKCNSTVQHKPTTQTIETVSYNC